MYPTYFINACSWHIISKETMCVLIKSATTHSTSQTTFQFAEITKHSNMPAPSPRVMLTFHKSNQFLIYKIKSHLIFWLFKKNPV